MSTPTTTTNIVASAAVDAPLYRSVKTANVSVPKPERFFVAMSAPTPTLHSTIAASAVMSARMVRSATPENANAHKEQQTAMVAVST